MVRTAATALAVLLIAACTDGTGPGSPGAGAATLPMDDVPGSMIVERFESRLSFNIADTESGLIAIAGLPADISDWQGCGGTEPRDPFTTQAVFTDDVVHVLRTGVDVHVHVFPLPLSGLCTGTPLASGTGRAMYVDNDYFASGTRTNTWGFRIQGTLATAEGGLARLNAHARFQLHPDGTRGPDYATVSLTTLP